MKALIVHNFYQQPGGEDQVFRDESAMLRDHGHAVCEFTAHNETVDALSQQELARKTIWNHAVYQQIRHLIRRERPDVAHFHNTFPLVSPSAYQAAHDEGVAVVQTLHNYRLICPAATLYRRGQICEACVGRTIAWPGILHRCYRDSALATGLSAAMVAHHWQRGTWNTLIDTYIALTAFSRRKFIQGGLPAAKIVVKPNFVLRDPGAGRGGGGYAAFVGRLIPEKGIATMIEAWQRLGGLMPLKIIGDGPLRDKVIAASRSSRTIEWLGRRSPSEVLALLSAAEMTIFPSEWPEAFGRTIVESFAVGTPVVAARVAAVPELVSPNRTGRLFEPANAADLAREIRDLVANPQQLRAMRPVCRRTYETQYTQRQNYPLLLAAYRHALGTLPRPVRRASACGSEKRIVQAPRG